MYFNSLCPIISPISVTELFKIPKTRHTFKFPNQVNMQKGSTHYSEVIMDTMATQITSLKTVYSTIHSGGDQRKHQSAASLAFVRGIHRRPVNSPHKWPVTRKMFPFDDVIMNRIVGSHHVQESVYIPGTLQTSECHEKSHVKKYNI